MKNFISLILIVGAIGLFFGYTNKRYQEIKTAKVEIEDLTKSLKQSKDILTKRADLQKRFNAFKATDLKSLDSLLPDYVDNVKLVLDMNTIAKKHGMDLKAIKVNESKSDSTDQINPIKEKNGSISVSFTVTAPYERFVSFLKDIEKSLRVVDVTSLSFKASDTGVYDYSVTLKTYWLNK